LATPQGHQKLKRILKAWVNAEVDQVYWQGLDSLCACFLSLNFNDEAMAFVSMRAFIHKFCKGFFGMENAKLMRQHMQSLWHLLSFHDPELAWHLNTIGIGPELYALSWFMTLFARN
jgi:TBC domain-containing protein kinase-like protein